MNIMETTILLLALVGAIAANPVNGGSSCLPGPLSLFPTQLGITESSTLAANTTCPVGELVRSGWTTSRSATCPWTYVTDFDPDRFPAAITRAVCRCRDHCLDPYTAEPNEDLQCTPVRYNLPVLRRGDCVGGVYEVVESLESVAVACTCLRREGTARRAPGIIG